VQNYLLYIIISFIKPIYYNTIQRVVISHSKYNRLFCITDIRDIKVVSQNSSLAEFGMDSLMVVEIKQTLEREFDLYLTAQEIRSLTFAKLIKMSDTNVSNDNMKDKEELNTENPDIMKFLISVAKDKDFISQPCFDLCTKKQETQIFLIPGIDGCGNTFNHLATTIKFSATFLQYRTNNIDATNIISETTDHLINVRNYISNFVLC